MTTEFDFSSAGSDANALVNKYVALCAGTAIATGPIPGTSALLTGTEATMVFHIARVYGYSPTLQEAANTIGGLVAASGILKTLAIEACTFIPIFGWLVKSSIAGASCKAIGNLAISYYESKRRKGE
jgi:uncharacterized protein (DUF697 family)